VQKRLHNNLFTSLMITVSIIFIIVLLIITFIVTKFCRRYLKKTEMLLGQTKLKPVAQRAQSLWMKTDNEFTIKTFMGDHQIRESTNHSSRPCSFVSEDSQGNINPYAVLDLPNKKRIVFDTNKGNEIFLE
ncbi:unnamed protein product, partial [Didymodactylos carnosus]